MKYMAPSRNANYNALFTSGTAAFPFLCWENTTTVSDNGQKKKLTRGPPQNYILNQKSQPNKPKKNLPDKQDHFAASRDGDERERRSPLPEIIRSSYPHLG